VERFCRWSAPFGIGRPAHRCVRPILEPRFKTFVHQSSVRTFLTAMRVKEINGRFESHEVPTRTDEGGLRFVVPADSSEVTSHIPHLYTSLNATVRMGAAKAKAAVPVKSSDKLKKSNADAAAHICLLCRQARPIPIGRVSNPPTPNPPPPVFRGCLVVLRRTSVAFFVGSHVFGVRKCGMGLRISVLPLVKCSGCTSLEKSTRIFCRRLSICERVCHSHSETPAQRAMLRVAFPQRVSAAPAAPHRTCPASLPATAHVMNYLRRIFMFWSCRCPVSHQTTYEHECTKMSA